MARRPTTPFYPTGGHPGQVLMNLGIGLRLTQPSGVDTTAPTISSTNSFTVAENAQLSKTLTANESCNWSIVGGADQAQFELSGAMPATSVTLRWSANGTRDFEAPADADANNEYVVQVRATDLSGNVTNQTITGTVTNVAEGPTLSALSLVSPVLIENSPEDLFVATVSGITIGSTVTLTNTDGGRIKYSNGEILVGATVTDADTHPTISWELTETYTDATNTPRVSSGSFSATAVADETAPTVTSSNSISIPEEANYTHTVTASEAVAAIRIVGGADQAQFSLIQPDQIFLSARDYENPSDFDGNNTHVVGYQVSDAAGNWSATNTATFTVTDIADTDPPGPTTVYQGNQGNGQQQNTFNFDNIQVGAERDDKMIGAWIIAVRRNGSPVTVSSVTLKNSDGTNSTSWPIRGQSNLQSGNDSITLAYVSIDDTRGPLADATVVLSDTAHACDMAVHTVIGQESAIPQDIQFGNGSVALDILGGGGLILSCVAAFAGTAGTITWTGINEESEVPRTTGGVPRRISTASQTGLSAETNRAISAASAFTAELVGAVSIGPAFRYSTALYRANTATNGVSASGQTMFMDGEHYDRENLHTTGANGDRITIPAAVANRYGRFHASFWGAVNGDWMTLYINKNGATWVGRPVTSTEAAGSDGIGCVSAPVPLTAADIYRMQLNTGATLPFDYVADKRNHFGLEILPSNFNGALMRKTATQAQSASFADLSGWTDQPGSAPGAYDLGGWFNTATSTIFATVPAGLSGYCRVSINLRPTGNQTGDFGVQSLKNGAVYNGMLWGDTGLSTGQEYLNLFGPPVPAVAGDQFKFQAQGTTAGSPTWAFNEEVWFAIEEVPADCIGALVYRTNSFDIGTNTLTPVQWANSVYNNHNIWSAGAPQKLTVPLDWDGARVRVGAQLYTANVLGQSGTWIRKTTAGGVAEYVADHESGAGSSRAYSQPLVVRAGDWFQAEGLTTNGEDVNPANPTRSWMWMERVKE